MASNFVGGKFQAQDATGPLSGALLYTYAAGTTTPLATYTLQDGLSSNANPVVCDSAGQASVWLGTSAYRMILKTSAGVTVWDVDNIAAGADLASFANTSSVALGDALIGVKRTDTGSAATTVHAWIEAQPLNLKADFGAVGDGATDDSIPLQTAVTAALASGKMLFIPAGTYLVTTGLSAITTPVRIYGAGQEKSVIQTANDITIFNFSVIGASRSQLRSFQLLGKGAGATLPAVKFTNTNYTALDDMFISKFGYGVQYLPGAIAPQSCYLCSITNSRIISNVTRNIDGQANTNALYIANTTYGGGNTIVPAGGLKLLDSNTLQLIGCDSEGCSGPSIDLDSTTSVNCGHQIIGGHIEGNTSAVGDIRIGNTGTVIGVTIMGTQFSPGAGADSGINAVRCSGLHAVYQCNGSYTGVPFLRKTTLDNETLISVNGFTDGRPSYQQNAYKANYTDQAAVSPLAATSFDSAYSDSGHFLEYQVRGGTLTAAKSFYAGLDALRIASGGGAAGAGHVSYARGCWASNGFGGTANARALLAHGAFDQMSNVVTYSASMTPDASLGNDNIITATNNTAFAINAPTLPPVLTGTTQFLTITLRNTSGGALGAATWNAIYKMSAWTNPATGFSRSITFKWDGTNWVQMSQTGVDVPN